MGSMRYVATQGALAIPVLAADLRRAGLTHEREE
jgi:hypothetical protein